MIPARVVAQSVCPVNIIFTPAFMVGIAQHVAADFHPFVFTVFFSLISLLFLFRTFRFSFCFVFSFQKILACQKSSQNLQKQKICSFGISRNQCNRTVRVVPEMGITPHGVGNLKTNSDFSYTAPRGTLARDVMTWRFSVPFLPRGFP